MSNSQGLESLDQSTQWANQTAPLNGTHALGLEAELYELNQITQWAPYPTPRQEWPAMQAERLHRAGYRKHTVVTTAAELDSLGFEAVVLDPCGTPAVCQSSGDGFCLWALGGSGALVGSGSLLESGGSCLVLYAGGES